MKSKNPFLNLFLLLLTAIIYPLLGTTFLRETEKTVREIGFSEVNSKNVMMGDVVKIIVAIK